MEILQLLVAVEEKYYKLQRSHIRNITIMCRDFAGECETFSLGGGLDRSNTVAKTVANVPNSTHFSFHDHRPSQRPGIRQENRSATTKFRATYGQHMQISWKLFKKKKQQKVFLLGPFVILSDTTATSVAKTFSGYPVTHTCVRARAS